MVTEVIVDRGRRVGSGVRRVGFLSLRTELTALRKQQVGQMYLFEGLKRFVVILLEAEYGGIESKHGKAFLRFEVHQLDLALTPSQYQKFGLLLSYRRFTGKRVQKQWLGICNL